ncbi:MAG: DUF1570 domain-containing protein, partial [Planctomycetales bacterium]|nr:DUF1570 domain-containing protein [Planctomycetales bacterium]
RPTTGLTPHMPSRTSASRISAILLACLFSSPGWGLEYVTLRRDGHDQEVTGRMIVEAADGGVLLESPTGYLWTIQPDEIVRRHHDDRPFSAASGDQLVEHIRADLPEDMAVHTTAHFAIFYNTSKPYAQWCGALYERLYSGFYNYWQKRHMELHAPEVPLIALVFADKESYLQQARQELGEAATSIVGYYSLQSNRIVTYDLTGVDQLRSTQSRRTGSNSRHINAILSRPEAAPLVATIIHEATHQLCYNSGLLSRHVDHPLWLSEGLAIFFETPDLGRSRGWRTVGAVHTGRLDRLRRSLAARDANALTELLASDQRLRSPETSIDAYAESWALCYYLLRVHPQEFAEYLQDQGSRRPLIPDDTEQRLARFRKYLGNDLDGLDREFLRYIDKL